MRAARTAEPPAEIPVRSAWAVLAKEHVTWRQVTEGWAVLAALGTLGLTAAMLIKAARLFRRA